MKYLSDDVVAHVAAALDEPDLEGTKYRLSKSLGRGGMGSVFEAEDVELGRHVALKVSSIAHGEEMATRLRREACLVARLEHPSIVPVHDVGRLSDGRVYYAMKLVRGSTFDEWAKTQSSLATILRMFQRICEAVAFAHANGVVHRDLKPANIMIGAFGEALVMDWGIARALDAPGEDVVVGTPAFMAPEQQTAGEAIDARADVFGLGATLREVLSARAEGSTAAIAITERATAGRADDRYASAKELADDVGRCLDGERVFAHSETLVERLRRVASRHRVVIGLLAAYVIVRVALAFFAR